jgi:hypothetical protein
VSLRIAITCYPTFGGSGILATELGQELARRGDEVHFVCSEMPWRLPGFVENVTFHEVAAREYPLFEHDPYVLALASKLVEVATFHDIDLFHVHYAIPHATAALLAQQILGSRATSPWSATIRRSCRSRAGRSSDPTASPSRRSSSPTRRART